MMTLFAIIYLLCMCAVLYTLNKHYYEFMEGISPKSRIIRNVIVILLAPVIVLIGIIIVCIENFKK